MERSVWIILNKNFSITIDGEIKNNKVEDKKFSPGSDIWTNELPRLGFSDEKVQKDYDNFITDIITLFAEPSINEVLIDAKILKKSRTVVEVLEEEEEFTSAKLLELEKKWKPERIIIEYNGMWNMKDLALPFHWNLEQQLYWLDLMADSNISISNCPSNIFFCCIIFQNTINSLFCFCFIIIILL